MMQSLEHRLGSALEGLYTTAEAWLVLASRVLLAVVLGWFGFHEVTNPVLWTGYVPIFAPQTTAALILVLLHGTALCVLAVAIFLGIAPRLAAAVGALMLLEIVCSLLATAGASDLVLRDVGVFGLAVAVVAMPQRRWTLRQ